MAGQRAATAEEVEALRGFLEHECAWRRLEHDSHDPERHRELVATACRPWHAIHGFRAPDSNRDSVWCHVILLQRRGEALVCVTLDRTYVGAFTCDKVHRARRVAEGLDPFYRLAFQGALRPVTLNVVPALNRPYLGQRRFEAASVYANCEVVSRVPSVGPDDVTCLGGAGVWAVYDPDTGERQLYAYLLCYDLFAGCYDGEGLPSLAKLVAETVACEQPRCGFCRGHRRHVDPAGIERGCATRQDLCVCFVPCQQGWVRVSGSAALPYLVHRDEEAVALRVDFAFPESGLTAGDALASRLRLRNEAGDELPIRRDVWQLMKVPGPLTELLVISCPVLKNLLMRKESGRTRAIGYGGGGKAARERAW